MGHTLCFYDTETSGTRIDRWGVDSSQSKILIPGDEVIQFSAIFIDEKFNIKRIINRYCNSDIEFQDGAKTVHNLTEKRVESLSEGKNFSTVVKEEGLDGIDNVTWIAYSNNFDMTLINQTLKHQGSPPINFGRTCNLLSFQKPFIFKYDVFAQVRNLIGLNGYPKLRDCIYSVIGYEKYLDICKSFADKHNIISVADDNSEDTYLHNAIYDVLGMMLIVYEFKNNLFE